MDFSAARPSDPVWWRWLHSRLDQVEARNLARLYQIQHAQNLAVLGIVNEKGVKEHWGRANDLLVKVFNKLFPWLRTDERDEAEEIRKSADALSKLWAETFGDPNDPAVQEKIWAQACALDPTMKRR